MGCIPFNAYDKHKIKARYFLSAFQIVKEPKCSDLEKIMTFIPNIISVVSDLVIPAIGSLIGDYVEDISKKSVSIDKFKSGVKLHENTDLRNFFDKQNPDFRMHVIIWALHDAFISKGGGMTNHVKVRQNFKNGTLTKEQLNYIFFIKQFIDPRKIDYNVTPYITESEIISYVDRVIKGHRKTAGYESFKTQAVGITKFINEITVDQYDPNKNGQNVTKLKTNFKKIAQNPFTLVSAGLGLYFTIKG